MSVDWTIIGLDNGLSPIWHQAIIKNSADSPYTVPQNNTEMEFWLKSGDVFSQ